MLVIAIYIWLIIQGQIYLTCDLSCFAPLAVSGVAGWPEHLGGHIFGEGPIPPSIVQLIDDFLIQDVGE